MLVALLLFSVAVPLAAPLISRSYQWVLALQRQHSALLQQERLRSVFQDVIHSHDSHRYPLFPRAHHKVITFSDGHPLPYHIVGDAISAIELASDASALVRTQVNHNQHIDLEFCLSDTAVLPPRIHGFAAISMDHITELQGEYWPGTSAGCHKGRFSLPERSMLFTRPAGNEEWLLLVPILRQFTLYLAEDDTLYYLSHQGSGIIERQPVLDTVPPLTIEIHRGQDDLSIELRSVSTEDAFSFSFLSRLTRRTPWNLILHDSAAF